MTMTARMRAPLIGLALLAPTLGACASGGSQGACVVPSPGQPGGCDDDRGGIVWPWSRGEDASEGASDPGPGPAVAGMCAEGEPDCQDMVTVPPSALPDGGGFADTCLEGATECADIPSADPAAPPADVEPTMVEPREGLVDVTGVPWVEVTPNDDQTALTVTWWGGNQACFGLDRVEVDESDDAVTLTVLTGREPGVEVCTEEAVYLATTVELTGELGPRSILDGTVVDS